MKIKGTPVADFDKINKNSSFKVNLNLSTYEGLNHFKIWECSYVEQYRLGGSRVTNFLLNSITLQEKWENQNNTLQRHQVMSSRENLKIWKEILKDWKDLIIKTSGAWLDWYIKGF